MALKRKRYTYEEMANVGMRYYNDKGFCALVAIASAAQVPFGLAKKLMERGDCVNDGYHRAPRQGSHWSAIKSVLEELGCTVDAPMNPYGGPYTRDYAGEHEFTGKTVRHVEKLAPKGLYLLYVNRHVLFMEDGKINDWTSSEVSGKACMRKINLVWKIERNFDAV
jgi:hypothetical protein